MEQASNKSSVHVPIIGKFWYAWDIAYELRHQKGALELSGLSLVPVPLEIMYPRCFSNGNNLRQ